MDKPNLKEAPLRELTYRGLCLATELKTFRKELAEKKASIERLEERIRETERSYEDCNVELKARKYHDVGHARSEFETKEVDGKRVPLTVEELDPKVKYYLELARVIFG